MRYKKLALGGVFALIVVHSISLISSGYGAYLIPESMQSIEIIALDSTSQKAVLLLDKQATEIDAQITNLQPYILTPSGKKSSVTAAQITTLQKQKSEILAQKAKAVELSVKDKEAYTALLDEAKSKHNDKAKLMQFVCVITAVIFEIIYILCTLYSFFFLYRVFVDNCNVDAQTNIKGVKNIANTPQTNTVTQQPNSPNQQPPNSRKIGFFSNMNFGETVCINSNCNSRFSKNSSHHKFCCESCKLAFHAEKHGGKKFFPRGN